MRRALLAALLVLCAGRAQARSFGLSRLVRGQMTFEGLDLSDDEPKAKKGKKAPPKKARSKKAPVPVAAPESPPMPPPPMLPPPPPGMRQIQQAAPPPPAVSVEPSKVSTEAPGEMKVAPPKKKPGAAMSFDALDVSGKGADRQKLEAAVHLFKLESYEAATLALQEVLKDPKAAELHLEARYVLAKSLYRLGMYHSALAQFKVILAKGPATKFFKSGLEWLFFIAHKTVNETIILEEVAKYANHEFPEKFRNEFRYLLAKYHLQRAKALFEAEQKEEGQKSLAETKRLVLMVPKGDPFYAKAKYLEGLASFKENDFAAALVAFKEVVRALNPRTSAFVDPKLRELAFMQLARTHYGHKQNHYAIFYYDKVEVGGEQWLEALFEASWAHFRIGQYERALGNLVTLSSPFFKEEYFPEALILKAVIYYENCRYQEARAILDEFQRIYMPVHDQLEKMTGGPDTSPRRFYDMLEEIQKRTKAHGGEGTSVLLERILKLALSDKDLKHLNESILELEREADGIDMRKEAFRYSDLAKDLLDELKGQRLALINKAGLQAKIKLESELSDLKSLLSQALRVQFETSAKEKEFLEQAQASGGLVDVVRKNKYSVAVSDEHLYWPYEGEYWRDELGTYQYTLTKGCRNQR